MRTARPEATWFRITELGPSATSGYPYYGGWGGSGYGGGGRKKEKSKHKDMSWSLEEERKAQEKRGSVGAWGR